MKWRIFTIIVTSILIISVFYLTLPKKPLLEGMSFSQVVEDDQQQLLAVTLAQDQHYRIYTHFYKIPQPLVDATLLQEDRYFYQHAGVNLLALIKAFLSTYIFHQRRRGASTITMQVARMRYHIQSNTISGKLKQIYYALALEKYYSKRQILTAYFNLLPYGGNINGIGAASLIYFHRQPQNLTLQQILTLVPIPQNPNRRRPHGNIAPLALRQAQQRLFVIWQHHFATSQLDKATLRLPIHIYSRHQLAHYAPHFVRYILSKTHDVLFIHSSLSLTLQQLITHLSQSYINVHRDLGINNVSVLLINTHTMQVKAMLGSADFNNTKIHGQVNGVLAQRSPGSTLKPFIYALAIEQGLITPMTILYDIPMHFHGYSPTNIDHHFLGPLTAQRALILSRNIPAVFLEEKLHQHGLYDLLKHAHIRSLQDKQHYGLSLALGGSEINMLELIKLYAMLKNLGWYQPLQLQQNTSHTLVRGHRLISKEASYITLSMLAHHHALNTLNTASWIHTLPSVAWKTGTSSAYRDAWAVGLFGDYALIVWVGNFSARSNPNLTGLSAAAPLLFKIIQAINYKQHPLPPLLPKASSLNVKRVAVCANSGHLATPFCPQVIKTWFIPTVSSIQKDNIYRLVPIDSQTGLRACIINHHTIYRIYPFYPSNIHAILTQLGINTPIPPSFDHSCHVYTHNTIHISSPLNQRIYHLSSTTHHLALTATQSASSHLCYWFIDKQWVATTVNHRTYSWLATPGQHTIAVVDEFGNSDIIHINVIE